MSMAKAVFLGSKHLGLAVFSAIRAQTAGTRWTVIHPDDREDPRSCLPEFQRLGVELEIVASASAARERLLQLKPDIGFVCGWYWLLDTRTIDLVPNGLWGLHNSLLPRYRGGAPLVWAIMNGDTLVGSTVFRISTGMDDGPILHQVGVACEANDAIGSVLARIEARLVAEVPAKWLELLSGRAGLLRQDESQATYCGQRIESDGVINWTWPARRVHDFVRAQSPPYPCAYSHLGPDVIRFVRTRVRAGTFFGTPGQVLLRQGDAVLVACGESTALQVETVRMNGAEASASSVIRSVKDRFRSMPLLGSESLARFGSHSFDDAV